MTNRANIRQQMLDFNLWRGCGHFVLTGADARSLTATTFGQGGDSMAKFANRYLYVPYDADGDAAAAGDVLRRVREFDSQKRLIWHEGPDYGVTPEVGATVEVWPYDPADVNAAITRALTRRCKRLERTDIITDGSDLYTIGTAPFDTLTLITDPDDEIYQILQVYGSDPTTIRTEPWDTGGKTFRGELNDGALGVRFDPPPQGTIRVVWGEPYTDLPDDVTTTNCPLYYVAWAAVFELFIALEERAINHGESQAQYARMKASAEERFMREHTAAIGEFAGRRRRIRRARTFRPAPSHNLRGQGYGASGGFYR